MKSLKLATAVCAGVPLGFAWLLAETAWGEFWEALGIGFVLWSCLALLTLGPAALRMRLARRGREDSEAHETAWRVRQRASAAGGLKLVIVLGIVFALLALVNEAAGTQEPGEHGVRIEVPASARWVSVTVDDPDAHACDEEGTITVAQGSRRRLRVTVAGRTVDPVAAGFRRLRYEIPLSWERTSNSCYYEFPSLRSRGRRIPAYLYLPLPGSAVASIPEPTRMSDGQWGWRCTTGKDKGCAVMAVVDHDPNALLTALALLLGGALLTVAVSLLAGAGRTLWRGWTSDAEAVARLLRRIVLASWRGSSWRR